MWCIRLWEPDYHTFTVGEKGVEGAAGRGGHPHPKGMTVLAGEEPLRGGEDICRGRASEGRGARLGYVAMWLLWP